ncbi:MAG: 50S ribosomal protein L22 [Candidatus Gracilibacteria bacterium]|nr:50S ribosomal protein L22 [Candidatus Gracilibacteria bacterium]
MKAHLRKVRIAQKKVNIVAGLVRGKPVNEAMEKLRFMPQKAAKHLYKVIQSAVANAEQNENAKRVELAVSQIVVNRGEFWRRFLPSTRGRALPLMKPTCHISVFLEKRNPPVKTAKKNTTETDTAKKTTKKPAEKTETKSAPQKSTTKTGVKKSTPKKSPSSKSSSSKK